MACDRDAEKGNECAAETTPIMPGLLEERGKFCTMSELLLYALYDLRTGTRNEL